MMIRAAIGALLAVTVAQVHAQEPVRPMVTVGQIEAPRIDGEIGEDEWADATGVGGFLVHGGALAGNGPSCMVARDERGLVVAHVNADAPDAKKRGRDGAVWQDDAIEVFVQPSDTSQYYQVIVNAAGDIADFEGRSSSWDADVEAAVRSGETGWSVEMRIPWEDLGGAPKPGETWRVNFARDIADGQPLTWAQMDENFHEPENFGEMRFVAGTAPIGVASVTRGRDDRVLIDARVAEGTLTAALLDGGHETASATTAKSRTLALPIATPGDYVLRMTGTAAGKTLFRQELPVTRQAPLEVTLKRGLVAADRVVVQMDASASGRTPERFRVSLGDLGPVMVDPVDEATRAETTFGIAALKPGTIPVIAEALVGDEVVARAETSFELPPDPQWLGSDIGLSDEVPDMYSPVRVTDGAVSVWGREYDFGRGPLLSGLTTGDEQVLASPMRVVTVAGGRQQAWREVELDWTERADQRAEGVVSARADSAAMRCDVACEFDGMMRFDLEVAPVGGEALEEIVLEIPLRAEHAKYLHLANASWGGSVSTALPAEGWEHHFMPFVWLGDERRGVQWFGESDEGWRPADPERAITISTRDGVTTLRLRMVEEALKPGKTFCATFGLQATPVREVRPQHREWHITHGAWYGMEDESASVSAYAAYPAEGNLDLERGTVEMWVSPLFDPGIEVERSERGRYNRELLRIVQDNGDYLGFYWNIDDRSLRLYTRLGGDLTLYASPGPQEPWEQGSWHHVAFAWGGGAATIWLDGEKVASRPWDKPLLPGPLGDGRIALGTMSHRLPSEFAVDELRISSMPRTYDGLPPRDLPGDKRTLLLDGFDGEAPEFAADGTTRTVHGAQASFIDGVEGRAIAFGAPDETITILDYLKEQGVNTLVIHQQWTEIQAYGSTSKHQEKLRSLVEACHERDIRLLIYFGYELSNVAPEWELYRDEILVKPRRGGYTRHDYPQTAYTCCFKSPWKEYYLTSIARMIDEYDIDGVYLDGTTEPFGCTNALHGCGYVGADGERHRTYPVFAVRDLMRRMRHVIKSRKPDGLISAHMSATVSIPTLAFVDSYWDGEQLDVHEHGFRLPLDAYRAEFMGHNWGVPAEFLSYLNRPFTYEESVPLALLHDVPVRPYARGNLLDMMSRVWGAWDAIEIEQAEWFPYWQGDGPVSAPSEDVLVSTHVGPGGMLVVAMNASGEDRTMRLDLPVEGASARELMRDREYEVEDGALTIDAPAWEGAVLLVQ